MVSYKKADANKDYPHGLLFEEALQKELKEKFCFADADPDFGERLFFENSGGSLRLKKCVEAKAKYEQFPDCPERIHSRSVGLKSLVENGTKDILETVFGAKIGALITELTASQTMFHMVEIIMENVPGKMPSFLLLNTPRRLTLSNISAKNRQGDARSSLKSQDGRY